LSSHVFTATGSSEPARHSSTPSQRRFPAHHAVSSAIAGSSTYGSVGCTMISSSTPP